MLFIHHQAGGKGWGIVATARIPKGTFVIEYVGEVIDSEELEDRAENYINDKHFYFLTLDANECIDARRRGNWARFINHSCDPNCQTQKWMVNGEVRIGIFTMRDVLEGEELTFDYQFERFGSKKQRCLCGSANCCQYIGGKIEKLGPQPVRFVPDSDLARYVFVC
jgi:SET domain-containing protein